jgi:hypothetical protein
MSSLPHSSNHLVHVHAGLVEGATEYPSQNVGKPGLKKLQSAQVETVEWLALKELRSAQVENVIGLA